MNAELPPIKNRKHNFESASSLNRDITPLRWICGSAISPQYRADPDGRLIELLHLQNETASHNL